MDIKKERLNVPPQSPQRPDSTEHGMRRLRERQLGYTLGMVPLILGIGALISALAYPAVAYAGVGPDVVSLAKEHWIITSVMGFLIACVIISSVSDRLAPKTFSQIVHDLKEAKDEKEALLPILIRFEKLLKESALSLVTSAREPQSIKTIRRTVTALKEASLKENVLTKSEIIEVFAQLATVSKLKPQIKGAIITGISPADLEAANNRISAKAVSQKAIEKAASQVGDANHIILEGKRFIKEELFAAQASLNRSIAAQLTPAPEPQGLLDKLLRNPITGPIIFLIMGGGLIHFAGYEIMYLGHTEAIAFMPDPVKGTSYDYFVRYGIGSFGTFMGLAFVIMGGIVVPLLGLNKEESIPDLIQKCRSYSAQDTSKKKKSKITELLRKTYCRAPVLAAVNREFSGIDLASIVSYLKEGVNLNAEAEETQSLLIALLGMTAAHPFAQFSQFKDKERLLRAPSYERLNSENTQRGRRSNFALFAIMLSESKDAPFGSVLHLPNNQHVALVDVIPGVIELIKDRDELPEVRLTAVLLLKKAAERKGAALSYFKGVGAALEIAWEDEALDAGKAISSRPLNGIVANTVLALHNLPVATQAVPAPSRATSSRIPVSITEQARPLAPTRATVPILPSAVPLGQQDPSAIRTRQSS